MKDAILVLTTGGTIDDLEYSSQKDAPPRRPSMIPKMLKKVNPIPENVTIEEVLFADSAFITDSDRA